MRFRTERATRPGRRATRGFTLVEGLVTLVIVTVLVVGLLTLLDSSNRLAKQETQVADAQGAGRSAIYEVTRLVRQARVGRLSPLSSVMPFVNNATDETITAGTVTHTLRPGTDALQIRGVLFDDSFRLTSGLAGGPDVVCAGVSCTGLATVTIRQQVQLGIGTGYENFPAGQLPAIAARTEPFYFTVSDTETPGPDKPDQWLTVTTAGGPAIYSIKRYYVGRVDANAAGTWYVYDGTAVPPTFSFTIDFSDATAMAMNATNAANDELATPLSGGVVDEIILFVDRGPQDPAALGGGYTHPFLAQAIRRGDGSWDVQRLVDDVEDLQFAFGIDGIVAGSTPDRGIDPAVVSSTKDADEWVLNVSGEELTATFDEFLLGPPWILSGSPATPALRAVFVSVVTKSLDPDMKFDGPGALGIRTFDSTAQPVSTQPYRRRAQTMAVNLRNFS